MGTLRKVTRKFGITGAFAPKSFLPRGDLLQPSPSRRRPRGFSYVCDGC